MVDSINALFNMAGGVFVFLNVIRLHKDKRVRGVSAIAVAFFTTWAWWKLLYYPLIGQHASAYSAGILTMVHMVWLSQMIYYNRKERHGKLL